MCACELRFVLNAPHTATIPRELTDTGIVKKRRQGKWTYYRIGDTAVLQLLEVAAALAKRH